ncbi:MAG: alpha/beta hydrolase [Clostridiales bacterium]|jgi:pimeloyl-ACP methyl ester carboxylesterase|nr:alpha/beta hydrolase [Clostridiales bacterium]
MKSGGFESLAALKHHQLSVLDGQMSVYEAGDAAKPKVVMLHGAMYDEARFIWDQMFPYLCQHYHVFAVDTPRHGKSRPWAGNLHHTRLMDILNATFNQLNLESFSMIGLSMGGGLCIEYASLHPAQVKSMCLFEPGGLGEKLDRQFTTWCYIKTPGMLRYLSKKYKKSGPVAIEKLLESLYTGGTKPIDAPRLISILTDEINGKFEHGENDLDDWQLNIIGPFKQKWTLYDRIGLIRCPTLWLRGEESTLVKQHEMERAVDLARSSGARADLVVIKNGGHLLPLEQPEKANAMVRQFLDETTG